MLRFARYTIRTHFTDRMGVIRANSPAVVIAHAQLAFNRGAKTVDVWEYDSGPIPVSEINYASFEALKDALEKGISNV